MREIIGVNEAVREAERAGVSPQQWALESGNHNLLNSPYLWIDPDIDDEAVFNKSIGQVWVKEEKNALADYCKNISDVIQFPVDTAYLFGLGIVASAMVKSFYCSVGPDQKEPVNLYVVGSQPPSTGKSGVMKYLADPVREGYDRLARENASMRAGIIHDIKKIEKDIEASKNKEESVSLAEKHIELSLALNNCPDWEYATDDGTPEAIGEMAFAQGGMFNIISDESDAVNTVLGNNYVGTSGSTNHSVFLKGWDNGYYKPVRITRKGGKGNIRGCIVILAQDESINKILEEAIKGRGIPERVLMLKEANILGSRVHSTERIGVEAKNKAAYVKTIENILSEQEDVILTLSKDAMSTITATKNAMEPHLADGEKYSQSTLRGIIGKMDKQVLKIAGILHGVKEWGPRGKRSTVIEYETIHEAVRIFHTLKDTYINAADEQGFSGKSTYEKDMLQCLVSQANKNKLTKTYSQLRDLMKNKQSMNGVSKITKLIKDDILPDLEKRNICLAVNGGVFINPKIKD